MNGELTCNEVPLRPAGGFQCLLVRRLESSDWVFVASWCSIHDRNSQFSASADRQLDRKDRSARRVVRDVDAAAVLGDDPSDDRETKAAAAPLRRIVRHEELLAIGRRN